MNRTVKETLAQIVAPKRGKTPGFAAGIVLWDDVVIEAAPIVHKMKRQKWTRDQVRKHCEREGWSVSVVSEVKRARP